MITNQILAKLAGLWFWERWHPEVALRYLPLVSEIKKMGSLVSILEVGSGGLGIVPYLKREVTGADVDFYPPYHPLLKKIKTDAAKLPFPDLSFDVVISSDALEHMNSSKRKKAITEMMRVAKRKVLIGVPCGKLGLKQDLILDTLYRKSKGNSYHFLEEQIGFGLPEKEEIHDTIRKAADNLGKKITLMVAGNENLTLRMFLMKGFINKNRLSEIFFRKILLFFIPIMRRLNKDPVYRQIFTVNIEQ